MYFVLQRPYTNTHNNCTATNIQLRQTQIHKDNSLLWILCEPNDIVFTATEKERKKKKKNEFNFIFCSLVAGVYVGRYTYWYTVEWVLVCVCVRLFTASKLHYIGLEREFDAWKNFHFIFLWLAASRIKCTPNNLCSYVELYVYMYLCTVNCVYTHQRRQRLHNNGNVVDDYNYDDDLQFISTNLIQLVNYMPPQRLCIFIIFRNGDTRTRFARVRIL